ncbi:hypothetical protein [Streptosporangium longisporum]|uniref:hypothetical protein n=1 Tax=Streptosporangium longisporum TaxID=46187 RepID=UPI003CD0A805
MTVTEAKQPGAAGDRFSPLPAPPPTAVCVAVPRARPQEPFGGPRSTWGAASPRAVHTAVHEGAHLWSNRDASTTYR